jgi:polyisoprenoid-binding protein YceI
MRSIRFSMMLGAILVSGGAAFGADFTIDPVHSAAIFKVKHMGASYTYGQFTDIAGQFSFDPAKPEASSVEVTIKADSINTHNEMRDRHLKGPDFFDTKENPTLSFKSTAWKKTSEHTYDVTGDITLRGKSKSITVPVEHVGDGKDPRGNELTGFHTMFTIDRSEFGINYGLPDAVPSKVEIIFSVEGTKKK